ncbi:carboxymuconolactone decarboxylase family protein [Halosquirtibacter xylanolyticus]|uniref:carboxymuconolactone decarboxylase family protein n=1 Tax=Halosquirtibacter xylanolyticus TaxID=3374599 RepID=UPI0037482476|nr:carboxymuconolactone decarboxylase family protein [Prolixibacteraceae bacterium]
MGRVIVPTKDQVDDRAKEIFNSLENQIGMLPNLYATIGYSPDVLEGYLKYSSVVGASSFNKKEIESVKLAVAQVNGCEYCISAHTAISKMNGFTDDELLAIRKGEVIDPHLGVIVDAAQDIANNRGRLSQDVFNRFFAAGFDNRALIDLVALVNVSSFTNFIHNTTQVDIDFPLAPEL